VRYRSDAEPRFEPPERMAQGRLRHSELGGGAGEATDDTSSWIKAKGVGELDPQRVRSRVRNFLS
jgi:hypothetical protein